MNFQFATASRVVFGSGTRHQIPRLVCNMGQNILMVGGSRQDSTRFLESAIEAMGGRAVRFAVSGEPDMALIESGVQLAKAEKCEVVIGMGGGSVMDAAKAIAALVANPGPMLNYLEVVGKGQALDRPSIPCIAVPTTAGTGAEVTCNAVIACPEYHVKVSLRHESMFPRVAVVDPELTHDLPKAITMATALDALTQLIEAYVSIHANPMTDALCVDGIGRAANAIPLLLTDHPHPGAREDMALAALFSGMALANAKLGAVHGFAGPLGGMFPIAHGLACGLLLAPVMETNIQALQARSPESEALHRYARIAEMLTGDESAGMAQGIHWIRNVVQTANLKPLSEFGISEAHIPDIVKKAQNASSMKGNPVLLSQDELAQCFRKALHAERNQTRNQ